MIEQGLFKRHFVGRDGFIWWIGQIASEVSWKENIPGRPVGSNSDIKGFGERYRVRIMGYQTADPTEITDEELPWAYVMYPTTAGGGGRSSSQSANLAQGTFVFGFFLDGDDAQTPVVMGVLGNNDYAAVSKNIPTTRFVPFSGYTESDYVAWYAQRTETGGDVANQNGPQTTNGQAEVAGDRTGTSNNDKTTESANSSNTLKEAASKAASEEQTQPIAKPSTCEPIPLGKIQKEMQNVITDIQKAQSSVYDYGAGVQHQIGDLQDEINKKVEKASEKITEGIKSVFTETEKYITRKVNNTMKDTYYLLFPNERPGLKKAVEDVNDLLACLFRQLIKGLLAAVKAFLLEAAGKVINVAQCLVENFVANILGQIVSKLLNALNSILSTVSALVGQAVSIVGDVLGVLIDLISFLSCEEVPDCSNTDEWNLLSGASTTISASDFQSIVDSATAFAASVSNATDLDNYDFDLNFDDLFNLESCGIGPVVCGPPLAQFWGGLGVGAQGNLIISEFGEVVGIDMISFGVNYQQETTYGNVYDECGNGTGAVIEPIVGDYTDENGDTQTGVLDIIIRDPGTGYLRAPNGSLGSNQYTWAKPQDTIVKRADGRYDVPKPPGNEIGVVPGDRVTIPEGSTVVTEPNNGQGGGETIRGGSEYLVTSPGTFTSPDIVLEVVGGESVDGVPIGGEYPSNSRGSYPVILYLCEINVEESGINYTPGDQVIITPDNGAVASATFDRQGRVTSVKVTAGGEGFTQYPQIYIQSETGYNAVLRPKLCIDRTGNDKLKEPTFQDKVLTVVDCVGKF